MKQDNYKKGKSGELLAKIYLKIKLYKIIEMNYKAANGEIDIIAKKGNTLVFVEVKYRATLENGYPREAVNKYKIQKITKTAQQYIATHNVNGMDFRFDVIEILGKHIEHIKNAF